MKKRNTIILLIAALLLSGLVGAGVGVLYTTKLTAGIFMIMKSGELLDSADQAMAACFKEPPQVGIWALNNHLSLINGLRDIEYPEQSELLLHELVTHARLASLCGRLSKTDEQAAHLEKAMAIVPQMPGKVWQKVKTQKDLYDIIAKFDKKNIP